MAPDAAIEQEAQRAQIELINLSPAGGFFVAFQVEFYGGMVLSGPFLFYFIATFVFPALKLNERKYVYRGLFYGGGLFLVGVGFCYFVLMPIALAASQMYSQWLGLGAYQSESRGLHQFRLKIHAGDGSRF